MHFHRNLLDHSVESSDNDFLLVGSPQGIDFEELGFLNSEFIFKEQIRIMNG